MTTPTHDQIAQRHEPKGDDYITIIAPTVETAMRQFRERGLDKLGYSLAGRVVRQRIALAGTEDAGDLFGGAMMVSATWFKAH